MAYTSQLSVKEVLLADYDAANCPSLQPFIDAANVIVLRMIPLAAARKVFLSNAELRIIETWLAAHFYAQSDQPYASRSTLNGSGQFQGRTDMYLESTKYGQTAMRLDTSGVLDALNKRKVAGLQWLGKPPSSQIPYDQRS
jgi:hypothetical protein